MDGTERTYDQTFNKSESKCLAYLESGIGWSRPGYIFCGWSDVGSSHVCKYNNGTKVYDLSLIPDDVVDLYAVWLSTSSHRIRYVRNIPGYDEVTREHVFWKGTSDTLAWVESQLNWNYKGYTFAGWARTKTATTAEFSNGQRVQDLAESGKTLTLYAVWTANNP